MNNVPFDTVPEYYNYHPSLKGNISLTLFPEPMLFFSVVRSTLKWRILLPAVAWPDRHDVHGFLFLSSLEFPIFDSTEMTNVASSGGMTGQAWCSRFFLFLSSLEFPIFDSTEMTNVASSGGMTGQAWCSGFLFLSSLEFPIFDNTEMTNFASSGGMTGQAWCSQFLFLSSLKFSIFDNI